MKFTGEMMTCAICGKMQRSHPDIESGWTGIELDDSFFYVCTDHLGKPHWSRQQHERAYFRVLAALILKKSRADLESGRRGKR